MKKYGKKVYDGSRDIKRACIGTYICPVCKKESKLIKQRGYGFENVLSVCESQHTCEIAKSLFEKYKVGDRIRLYESTFGKEAVLRLDSYQGGVIVNSYPDLIDYRFNFMVDKCVMNGHEITAPAWIIGHLHRGVNHSSAEVKLLKKVLVPVAEQLTLHFV